MNKSTLYRVTYMLIACMTMLMTLSCEYKDLEAQGTEGEVVPVRLAFDWSNVDSIPTRMQVMFYRGDTGSYQRFDVGNDTTTVYIAPGEYNITTWNNDATHVYFEGYGSRKNLSSKTPEFNPQNSPGLKNIIDSIFSGQQVLDYPDYMAHANSEGIVVQKNTPQDIILKADSMVVTVDLKIGGVAGLEIVKQVKGAISNVAGRRFMAYDNKVTDPATVLFEARAHPADSTITARFWVFGLEPEELMDGEHKAALFFWTTKGKLFIDMDITDIIRDSDGGSFLNIRFLDLNIDIKELLPESGLDVDIDEWDDDYKHIGF